MAFNDDTGGIDRLFFHTPEQIWGDDWGDRKPRRLADAARIFQESVQVDEIARQKYLARLEKIAADATRSRSASIEAEIERDLLRNAKSSMGNALLKAFANGPKVKARDRERPAPTV